MTKPESRMNLGSPATKRKACPSYFLQLHISACSQLQLNIGFLGKILFFLEGGVAVLTKVLVNSS